MNIIFSNSKINFHANITKTHCTPNNNYIFREILPENTKALSEVEQAAMSWNAPNDIATMYANDLYYQCMICPDEGKHFFVTLDKKTNEIVSLISCSAYDDKSIHIDYFQTKTSYSSLNPSRKIKGIGSLTFDRFLETFKDKDIRLESDKPAIGFYLKKGMKLLDDGCHMLLKR